MTKEFEYFGATGLKRFKNTVQFGDWIINHYASTENPHREGVFVRIIGKSIECTDMKGNFWRPVLDERSKLEIVGTVLNNNS